MAKKATANKDVTADDLFSRQYPGGSTDSENHDAEINEWLNQWKADATAVLRMMATMISEQALAAAVSADKITELESRLEQADAVNQTQANQISNLTEQARAHEMGRYGDEVENSSLVGTEVPPLKKIQNGA